MESNENMLCGRSCSGTWLDTRVAEPIDECALGDTISCETQVIQTIHR